MTTRTISTVSSVLICLSVWAHPAPAAAQSADPVAKGLLKDGTLYAKLLDVPPFVIGEPTRSSRPAVLPVLYVTFIGLESFDGYTTSRGLKASATEANPLVRWAVANTSTLWAIKGAAAFASIYTAERMWRHNHRAQAIATMVVSNLLMSAVAVENVSATRGGR